MRSPGKHREAVTGGMPQRVQQIEKRALAKLRKRLQPQQPPGK